MISDLLTEVTNPFPGLRPFEAHETHLFFGRDTATRELLRRLQRTRFLAVVGSSGSGKSSLARAGMLPALRGGLMRPPGSAWRIALLRPGDRPIAELAEALASPDALGHEAAAVSLNAELIETTLRRSSLGLVQAVRQARVDPDAAVLVVVDQFEELFRFHRLSRARDGGDEAAAFVALLLEAARQRELPIYVVLTMRSDFLGDCAVFRDLPEAINDGQYLIPRLTRDQLREAIAGPIAVGGAEITPRLLQRLLNDVGDNPDQLPILQHALMRTWERWRAEGASADAAVDLPHYEAIGGMADALNRHAEEAYGALSERDREIARRLFQRVSERGPDNREIRRPTKLRDVCAVTEADARAVIAVIDCFREGDRTFVMPPAGEPLTVDSVIDISHESLIRLWGRLREWVDEESASAARYRRLAEDAVRHEARQVALYRDPELSLALAWHRRAQPNAAWAERYHPAFASAMRFLEESRRERDRRVLRRRLAVGALALAVLVFAALAFVAVKQRQTAESERARADDALRNLEVSAMQTKRALEVVEQQRDLAKEATTRAEQEAGRANNALADAKIQRDEAQTQRRRAEAEAGRANNALADANTQRDEAQAQRRRAEASAVETKRALEVAQQQRDVAKEATVRAEQEAERARNALADAKSQRDTADRLRTTGLARQLVAQAELRQRDAPNQADLIALLATESLRRDRLFDNDRLLREILYLRRPRVDQLTAGAPVQAVAWSPDGRRIAAVTRDSTVVVWKYPGNEPPLRVRHEGPARSIAWSPDSRRLAVAADDRAVHIQDAESGRELGRLRHGRAVVAVAWSADGRLIVSASRDRTTRVWEANGGREVRRFTHASPPVALGLSADGTQVATADETETIRIWNAQTGQEVRTLPGYGRVDALAWSPDGQRLASGYTNAAIRIWDASSGKQLGPVLTHQYPVTALAWSPDGQYLASGSNDRTARLWEPREGHELARLAHEDNVSGVAWSHPDGRFLATSGVDGLVGVWDTQPADDSRRLVHSASIGTVTATADGRSVATASGDGERLLRVWDTTTRQERFRMTQGDRVQALALAGDGRLLAAGTKSGAVLVIDDTGRERFRLAHDGPVLALAWSADGQRLATGGDDDKPIVLWDVSSRRAVGRLRHGQRIWALAWSPDGQRLASGGDDHVVRVWNAATGAELMQGKHDNPVLALAWSADGRRLASGGGDRSARLWDLATRAQVALLPHRGRVSSLAWSADGAQIATFSGNRAYVWNAATGEELARATLPGGVRAGVLRTDIATLTTVSEIGRTLLVDEHTLRAEGLLAAACARLPRNLTPAEWKEFVGDEAYRKTCPNLP